MPGEVTFQPTEADYISAVRANFLCALRRPRALRNFAIITALGGIAGVAIGLLDGLDGVLAGLAGSAYGAVVWASICLGTLLLVPRRSARLFRQQRSIHRIFTYRWSDDGLECAFEANHLRTPWSEFSGYRDTGTAMLLYTNDSIFQFLPHRALDGEASRDLRDTVARMAVPRY